MTDLVAPDDVTSAGASRLSLPVRMILLIIAATALLFCAGMVVGIVIALIEDGVLSARGAALLAASVGGIALFAWASWKLSAYWRRPGRSAYEKRYTRMLLILFASGLPLGILIGMAGDGQPGTSLFSNGPLDPRLAAMAAIAEVLILGATLVIYHRSIDDHEQQAYLWANSIAFYFLALTLPAVWLLARGGLLPGLGFGSAMLILLGAFAINFAVWAWLKYR